MQITGKIIHVLPLASGISQSTGKPWKKQDFVLETIENYPKKAAFTLFGDKVDRFPISVGQLVNVTFDVNAREFQNRWYNSLEPWKIEPAGTQTAAAAPAANPANPAVPQTPYPVAAPAQQAATVAAQAAAPQQMPPAQNLPPTAAGDDNDDLPF